MNQLIAIFSRQLKEAYEIGEKAKLGDTKTPISNILVSGLGGSGIGGSIMAQLVEKEATVPISINKTYSLPHFVNENTLVIISSYSGNTEETISCLNDAIKKKAKIVCITSGGKIEEIARTNKLNYIIIPGGMPPRACVAYSLTQLFFILNHFKIITDSFREKLKASVDLIDKEEGRIMEEARNVAKKLLNKIPVIYSAATSEAICIRFRQQLNENAKVLCWHHVFPEMNHNELVGWKEKNDHLAVIIFRNENDYPRIKTRIKISKAIFKQCTSTVIELFSKGNSNIENAIYLIHLGDWISYFLAELKGVDAMEVDVIVHLKSELAKT